MTIDIDWADFIKQKSGGLPNSIFLIVLEIESLIGPFSRIKANDGFSGQIH